MPYHGRNILNWFVKMRPKVEARIFITELLIKLGGSGLYVAIPLLSSRKDTEGQSARTYTK